MATVIESESTSDSRSPSTAASQQHKLHRALAAHRDGKLDIADAGYRQIPADSPRHADACHYGGFIHFQLHNLPFAIALSDEALALKPDEPSWLNDRGIAAAGGHRHEEAVAFLYRAIDLARQFARATGAGEVLTATPVTPYDFWCPLMSVPSRLDDEVVPAHVPYLFADTAQRATWHERVASLTGERRKIGLVWTGNPRHRLDTFRSIALAELLPIADAPNTAWFALQKGAANAQCDDLRDRWTIHSLEADLHDFDATTAAIGPLDLVITIDTSIVHLAGAPGKPVWVLLPAQPDWRWLQARGVDVAARLRNARVLAVALPRARGPFSGIALPKPPVTKRSPRNADSASTAD